jgi:esterase/lipase
MNLKKMIVIGLLISKVTFSIGQNSYTIDVKYFPANGVPKDIVILILGGSQGGYPNFNSDFFTTKGFSVLEVAYFGTPNTPESLEMIPLEYFEKVLSHCKTFPEFEDKRIALIGSSKGAELALLLASKYPVIEGVIAKAPSSVVFQSILGSQSSWSFKNEAIPFVPYVNYDFSKVKNMEYLEMYQLSLENQSAVAHAEIAVENINGPILLFSGKDDKLWPSSMMAEMIIRRLSEKGFKFSYEHISYEDAGHTFSNNLMFGGTLLGNKVARDDFEEKCLSFLKDLALNK